MFLYVFRVLSQLFLCFVYYAQTLIVVNLILVIFLFGGHNSDSRGRIWTKIGHVKAASLPDIPKPLSPPENSQKPIL